MNIEMSLLQFGKDEGKSSAIRTAEEWRDSLEAMLEVSSPEAVNLLLDGVRAFIKRVV